MAWHIHALGLWGTAEYLLWCRDAGVSPSLEKSVADRTSELQIAARRKAAIQTRAARARGSPRRLLTEACAGTIDPADVERPRWREVVAAIARSKAGAAGRTSLADFLLHMERVSDLVFETTMMAPQPTPFAEGLVRLHERKGQWLRDPLEWRPRSHNADRQFASLARHLLARYEVPAFLDRAWFRGDRGAHRFRDWFIHIGRGHNIRTAKTPYPMTKMMAHHFVQAPSDVTIEGALLLADIRSLGGGRRLATSLLGTRLAQRIEDDPERRAFWLSVYRFFIANPMLDLRHVGPIVDFLAFQRFESQRVMVGPGQVEIRPPPQPNLSMARRTPETLLRQVEAWHGQLRLVRTSDNRFWNASGITGLSIETGPRDRPSEQVRWSVRELLSGSELIDEGRRLKHCVATYADSCMRGVCSIWSLERRRGGEGRGERVPTVAIDASRVMVEARGFANRVPTEQEKGLLERWMRDAGVKPGPYLYGW